MLLMKVKRINQNKIQFILTSEDLSRRNLKVDELAYGSKTARLLFDNLIELAHERYDIKRDNTPIVVEAIPLSSESIMIVITKVNAPEELDPHFSQFSKDPNADAGALLAGILPSLIKSASDVIEAFNDLKAHQAGESIEASLDDAIDISKLFFFHSLDSLICVAHLLEGSYRGKNTLFKAPQPGHYLLVVNKSDHSPEEFNKTCNLLSEYSEQQDFSVGQLQHFEEHFTIIEKDRALSQLAQL